MPKMKSHSGMSKRVRTTGTGKLVHNKARRKAGAAFASTPVTGSRKLRRRRSGMAEIDQADVKRVKRLIGR